MNMKKTPFLFLLLSAPLLPLSCATNNTTPTTTDTSPAAIYPFESVIPHAPKITGYTQVAVKQTAFRDRAILHPTGTWTVSFGAEKSQPPILITTASGKRKIMADEWYPEEGGADAAGVYAFVKGDETLLVFQGTSDFTYEETRVTYKGDTFAGAKRYAIKGAGMGPDAPGIEPKYKTYP